MRDSQDRSGLQPSDCLAIFSWGVPPSDEGLSLGTPVAPCWYDGAPLALGAANCGGPTTNGADHGCQICPLGSTINGLAFLPGVRVSMDGGWIIFPVPLSGSFETGAASK